MTTSQRISKRDAEVLASGGVPSARADLEPLAALLEDYRAGMREMPVSVSWELSHRLDLDRPAMVLQPQSPAAETSSRAMQRAGSGLAVAGIAGAIVMGAATGAAALVGSAGMLPREAQSAFDQIVSVIVPTEGAADGTTVIEEAPGDTPTDSSGVASTDAPVSTDPTSTPAPQSTTEAVDDDGDESESGSESKPEQQPATPATPATPAVPGTSGKPATPATPATPSSGSGNSHSGSSSSGNSGNSNSGKPSGSKPNGNSGSSSSNSGNGNSGSGNSNSGNRGGSGNSNSGNSNSGNSNSGSNHSGDHDDD